MLLLVATFITGTAFFVLYLLQVLKMISEIKKDQAAHFTKINDITLQRLALISQQIGMANEKKERRPYKKRKKE